MQQVWINIMIAAFFVYEGIKDIISRKISILLGMPLFVIGIAINIACNTEVGLWMPGMVFSLLLCGFSYVSGGQVGLGDGLILLFLSPLLGNRVISIFLLSMFLCALIGIMLSIAKKINRKSRLPLVPFMTIAYFLINTMRT